MPHDPRLVKDEDKIEQLRSTIPEWIKKLQRPKTPCVAPAYGPLEGIRAVGTGQLIAQPYIGTKLAEFGAEVIHVEKPGGDVFRFTAPQLVRGPRPTEAMRPKSRRTSCRWGSISRRRAASSF
jgi:CoA-transferase family III